MSTTPEDWSKAEALAGEHLKTDKHVSAPISFHRLHATPFLLKAWWAGADGKEAAEHVLVYDGKIHRERGTAALPSYFEFLGAAHLRTLSIDDVDTLLVALGPYRPAAPDVGAPWRYQQAYEDLYPAILEKDGVLKYVVHYVEVMPPSLPVPGEPPPPFPGAPPPPPGGGKPGDAPLVLQRWSLQLFPVVPNLDWKLEGRVERARPPVHVP